MRIKSWAAGCKKAGTIEKIEFLVVFWMILSHFCDLERWQYRRYSRIS
jgi:hypothetical protein